MCTYLSVTYLTSKYASESWGYKTTKCVMSKSSLHTFVPPKKGLLEYAPNEDAELEDADSVVMMGDTSKKLVMARNRRRNHMRAGVFVSQRRGAPG
jgi:hypothetical protein